VDPVVAKYLARYAAPEIAGVAQLAGPYAHVCAIPALDESADLLDGLRDVAVDGPWLAVVVVNATDAAAPDVHGRNAALLTALRDAAPARRISDTPPMWLVPGARRDMDVLVVDRASPGWRFPADQGVGLARRIGCDIALALHASGALCTRWIHMTDADVTLPADYFAAAARAPSDTVALAYRFWHVPAAAADTAIDAATGLYELYLRYHRLGLAWAGSPYAWHTLGSSLAVDVRAYAAVRGVPRRQAAEDFYLVNKLIKLGPVREPDIAPIAIRARRSARVPFGTGAATRTIAGDLGAGRIYRMYHPRVYALLGAWLDAMAGFAATATVTAGAGAPDARDTLARALATGAAAWQLAAGERRALDAALARLDAPGALLDARTRARSPDALARRLRDWFDAFRTLKLIHAARDAGLPSLPWAEALARAPFLGSVAMPAAGGAPAALVAQLAPVRQALMERERGLDYDSRGPGDRAERAASRDTSR
jgi:hypothetical protein